MGGAAGTATAGDGTAQPLPHVSTRWQPTPGHELSWVLGLLLRFQLFLQKRERRQQDAMRSHLLTGGGNAYVLPLQSKPLAAASSVQGSMSTPHGHWQ